MKLNHCNFDYWGCWSGHVEKSEFLVEMMLMLNREKIRLEVWHSHSYLMHVFMRSQCSLNMTSIKTYIRRQDVTTYIYFVLSGDPAISNVM
jgi:hypothetical protein